MVSSNGCVVSSNGWVDSSNGCVSSPITFGSGGLELSGERGSRARNPSTTLESSSRASIIFFSAVSMVFEGGGLGRGWGVGGS